MPQEIFTAPHFLAEPLDLEPSANSTQRTISRCCTTSAGGGDGAIPGEAWRWMRADHLYGTNSSGGATGNEKHEITFWLLALVVMLTPKA
jgi:hypothetical protein